MIRYCNRVKLSMSLALTVGAVACLGPGDITGDEDDVVLWGTVNVATMTTGPGVDPDGYLASLHEGATLPIEQTGSVTFSPVIPGTYTVTLNSVNDPCTVTTPNPVYVLLMPDSSVTVQFDVSCP